MLVRSGKMVHVSVRKIEGRMAPHKRNLIVLLFIFICSYAYYAIYGTKLDVSNNDFSLSWIIVVVTAVTLVIYMLTIRCPNPTCKRRQVIRGLSIQDIRWPGHSCFYCSVNLRTKYKGGRPL